MYGAIEAGGTKFICGYGTGPQDVVTAEFPTRDPQQTISDVLAFFAGRKLRSLGVASFGPVDLRSNSPTYGYITHTPKLAWRNFDLLGALRVLQVPLALDTDVNAAALGEQRWGAGQGRTDLVYVTVGTGIGAGVICANQPVHGMGHPEAGHMLVRKHPDDTFAGCCPSHGDCWEGLASGPAIEKRVGRPAKQLVESDPVWDWVAGYIAQGLANLTYCCAPERLILGGGVGGRGGVVARVQARFERQIAGYLALPKASEYIVSPALGGLSGVCGALVLAQNAAES